MYYLIGYYGSRNKKIEEAMNKFFIYTLIGSLFLLLALLTLYIETGTTDYQVLLTLPIACESYQLWLWLGFFIAFAVKTPMWPVHIWYPLAHAESSTGASVILAAILLKLGMDVPKMNKFNDWKGFNYKQQWGMKRIGPHNKDIIDILIGSILGDGHLELTKSSQSIRKIYTKGLTIPSIAYAKWYLKLLRDRGYTSADKLIWYEDKKTKISVTKIRTVKFTSLKWLYEKFYPNNIKIIPLDIKNYLNPMVLAIWIMDECSFQSPGVKISVAGLSKAECILLQKALEDLYNLKISINKAGNGGYYLYIWKESISDLIKLVEPYILPE